MLIYLLAINTRLSDACQPSLTIGHDVGTCIVNINNEYQIYLTQEFKKKKSKNYFIFLNVASHHPIWCEKSP